MLQQEGGIEITLEMLTVLHIVSTKRLVFGKPAHMTESFSWN